MILDTDVRADEHLREVIADAAAADEHGVADLFFCVMPRRFMR